MDRSKREEALNCYCNSIDDFAKLGGEERDHELILLSLFKAMDGAKSYQLLERMLNDLFDFMFDL